MWECKMLLSFRFVFVFQFFFSCFVNLRRVSLFLYGCLSHGFHIHISLLQLTLNATQNGASSLESTVILFWEFLKFLWEYFNRCFYNILFNIVKVCHPICICFIAMSCRIVYMYAFGYVYVNVLLSLSIGFVRWWCTFFRTLDSMWFYQWWWQNAMQIACAAI